MKALQFLTDPEPWPERACPTMPRCCCATSRRRRWRWSTCDDPPLHRRRLARAAQPAHRHLRLGLEAGADGLRRRRRQPHDRVHLVPPGARPRGGRRRSTSTGPGGATASTSASGWCSTRTSVAGPAASRRCARRASGATTRSAGTSTRGACRRASTPATRSRRPAGSPRRCRPTRVMAFAVPDAIPDEVAVLADPWSVSFHAITRNPPPPGSKVRRLRRRCARARPPPRSSASSTRPSRSATIARWPAQADLARSLGADGVRARARARGADRGAGRVVGRDAAPPVERACPVAYPGHDRRRLRHGRRRRRTVEVGLRILREQGTLVQLGVSSPDRFEWTPWYFKELRLIGSNAFGDETFEGRRRARVRALLRPARRRPHRPLRACSPTSSGSTEWRDAFTTIVDQGDDRRHQGRLRLPLARR